MELGKNIHTSRRKTRKISKTTFTKRWVSIILIFALADLQFSYVLAFLGRPEIAQTLSVSIVTEILGVIVTYASKSYFETKAEKKEQFERDQLGIMPSEERMG